MSPLTPRDVAETRRLNPSRDVLPLVEQALVIAGELDDEPTAAAILSRLGDDSAASVMAASLAMTILRRGRP